MSKSLSSTRAARTRGKRTNSSIGIWIVGIAAAIVLLVVLAVALNSRQQAAVSVAAPDVPVEWLNRNIMGDPNAPVTVQAWEDFLCPACRQWTSSIEPQLVEEYIKPGRVKLEFRQFPLSGHAPGANMAAMASLCAADQDAFWTYHNRLFAAQDRGQPGYVLDALVQYSDELGLDSRAFLQCMSGQQYRDEAAASANEALALGLNATPSIMVGDTLMTNPFDYNELKAAIDSQLAASGN
jgi:protein-disulfide isomerase